jgi:hypothetical protein
MRVFDSKYIFARFQVSTAGYLRPLLSWGVMQHRLVIGY